MKRLLLATRFLAAVTFGLAVAISASAQTISTLVNTTLSHSATGKGSMICIGTPIPVSFTASGTFTGDNEFRVQLSNAAGSFANPTVVSTVMATQTGEQTYDVNAIVPSSVAPGSKYRVRVVSTRPVVTGGNNEVNLMLVASADAPAISLQASSSSICAGSSVTYTATATNAGANPEYTFRVNGVVVQRSNSNTFTSNSIFDGDAVTVSVTGQPPAGQGSKVTSFDYGAGFDGAVRSIVQTDDGKFMVGGEFSNYKGIPRPRICRLNADGSIDFSFNPGGGFERGVRAIAVQGDGKIIIGGEFEEYNGVPHGRIVRVTPTGQLDASFATGLGFDGIVSDIAVQPDGRIICVGNFNSFNDFTREYIARLNTFGGLDNTFNPLPGPNGTISQVAVQSDGRILIVGEFTEYNNQPRNRICRIYSNSNLDPGFDPGVGANFVASSVVLQKDGKILVGGNFTSLRTRIVRLNQNGGVDASFDVGAGFNAMVRYVSVQPDGGIIATGNFTAYGSAAINRLARLNGNGSVDANFNIGAGFNNEVLTMTYTNNGDLLVGGFFTEFDGERANYIVLIKSSSCYGSPTVTSNRIVMSVGDPVTPQVALSSNPTNATVCAGMPVTFTATAQHGGDNPVYMWKVNGQAVAASENILVLDDPKNGDAVTVELTSNHGCVTSNTAISGAVTLAVNALPLPTVSEKTVSDVKIIETQEYASYQWMLEDAAIAGATGQTHTPTQDGNYSVQVTDANGCTGTSPDLFVRVTSVVFDPVSGYTVMVYPNPAGVLANIVVNGLNDKPVALTLSDLMGRQVVNVTVHPADGTLSHQMDLRGLSAGSYFLSVSQGNNVTVVLVNRD